MTKIMKAISALLLLAAPAGGGGGEFEQKFHEAYAMEVVAGDVKGAALVYLSLMDEDDAPEAIRAESKFRFAVCAVLLGRADEGRTHLTELIQDPNTPEGVRKKAEDYRAAVAGIGVGTELAKKLQSLVFDLGRVSPYTKVDAYRDFEIIGKPSIPFLRKLLRHPDEKLRVHAFRLLCRMNEPGMAAEWQPDYASGGTSFNHDLTKYLGAHPDELAAFEKRVLTLGEEAIVRLAAMRPAPSFSLGFMRALVEKKSGYKTALAFIGWTGEPEARHALIAEWITGDDADLSRDASSWLLTYVQKKLPEGLATPDVFRSVVARLAGPGFAYSQLRSNNAQSGLNQLAQKRSAAELIEALGVVIEAGETWEGNIFLNPVGGALPQKIASSLDSRVGPDTDLAAYTALLDRWVVVVKKLQAEHMKKGYNARPVPDSAMVMHYATAVKAMPEAEAIPEIRRLLDLYDPAENIGSWANLLQPVDSPMRVRIVAETLRSARPPARNAWVRYLPIDGHQKVSDETVDATLFAMAELFPILPGERVNSWIGHYASFLLSAGRERAIANLSAILAHLPELDAAQRAWAIRLASGYAKRTSAFFEKVVPPVAAEAWDVLTPAERREFIGNMLQALGLRSSAGPNLVGEGRAAIGKFIRARYADLDQNLFGQISRYPDLFPPEEWIPLAPTNTRMYMKPDQAESDRIAKALATDVASMNYAAIIFIGTYASPAI